MNLHDIWVLYRRELRSALRERTIVVNSILMPIFLYPVVLWAMFSAISFVEGLNEGFTSRVAVVSAFPAGHEELRDSLGAREDVVFVTRAELDDVTGQGEDDAPEETAPEVLDEALALAALRAGRVDAILSFPPPDEEASALDGNFAVRIRYDRTEERSARAQARLRREVEDYRSRWVESRAALLGVLETERAQFAVGDENVSTSEDLGALLLGQLISLFLVIMVALGCFVPSVDTTAGERERSTWETLMTVGASRASVVAAKYLYVATLGIVAGLLNVSALFVSIGAVLEPLLGGSSGAADAITFSVPLLALPVMMAGAVALALFFASAMMLLASFARSFKDGQAMVQPVYWLALLPLLLGQQTDRTLSPATASIPVANISMMIRDAVNGVFLWPLIAQTILVTALTVVVLLAVARHVLRFEDFLLGSYDGSLWRFLRERTGKGRRTARIPS